MNTMKDVYKYSLTNIHPSYVDPSMYLYVSGEYY